MDAIKSLVPFYLESAEFIFPEANGDRNLPSSNLSALDGLTDIIYKIISLGRRIALFLPGNPFTPGLWMPRTNLVLT